MKTNVEKHVAVFDQVLGHCNALGGIYNPSIDSLKVAAMTSMLTSTRAIIKAADTAKSDYITAINRRQMVFRNVPALATRITNAIAITQAPSELISDIKLYRKKFQPRRRPKTLKGDNPEAPSPSAPPRVLSELDFESKVKNFGIIIELLKKESTYAPNEHDITIDALAAFHASLQSACDEVHAAKVKLRNARRARNEAIAGQSGIRKTTTAVKKYVLSAFGFNSNVYQTFKGLTLKSV